jgi:EAL and modified HD-GYP domain-containing signal transduction protein
MKDTADKNAEMQIFIARQPVFDTREQIFAYELLFRSTVDNQAHAPDSEYATLRLIANSLLIGLKKITTDKRVLINFNRQLLLEQIPLLFPSNLLGVEVLESVEPDYAIVVACRKFKRQGYLLVLDDFVFNERYWPLINLADIIKVDFQATPSKARREVLKKVGTNSNIRFLAEKVETREDYDEARDIGYHYFQGYYFQKPDLISRREIPGYKSNYIRILKKLHNSSMDIEEIEEIIKHDVSLTYKLLRLMNSASFGFRVTIHSVHHALKLLGSREIRKWLSIIVMSGVAKEKIPEPIKACIIRARLCETIADFCNIHSHPSGLFFMGMFSQIDKFLDRPMVEILNDLPLDDAINSALLGAPGPIRSVLKLAKAYEKGSRETVKRLAASIQLPEYELSRLHREAVEWSEHRPQQKPSRSRNWEET